ncbi:MAG TPA: hypothetical protein VHZ29_03010 [Rhizomicrobium sp.]|jgi:hypothetical protein|nr:hypothetical protein [Rhizomicrobium sp.]
MQNRAVIALVVVVLSIPAAGCWKDQQQAMNACRVKIPYQGKFPSITDVKTPIVLCMENAGYLRDFHNSRCLVTAIARRSEHCYRPKGFFAALGYRLEMLNQPTPTPPETHSP